MAAVAETPENNLFFEKVQWALMPYQNGLTTRERIPKSLREKASASEKAWGNRMIGATNNGQWTTRLGEGLVKETLERLGETVRRPQIMNHYSPDWETDTCIYEVKTRNWTTSGTAGEKVLGTMYKYASVPRLYGKPLKIVCVGYQQWELENANTKIFGEVQPEQQAFLDLAESLNIEYVKFSDLVAQLVK